ERLDQAGRDQTIECSAGFAKAQITGLERRLKLGQAEPAAGQVFEQNAVGRTESETSRPSLLGGLQLPARIAGCLRDLHRLPVALGGFAAFAGHLKALARLPRRHALRIPPIVGHELSWM